MRDTAAHGPSNHTTHHVDISTKSPWSKWPSIKLLAFLLAVLCCSVIAFALQTDRLCTLRSQLPPPAEEQQKTRLTWDQARRESALEKAQLAHKMEGLKDSIENSRRERVEERMTLSRDRKRWEEQRKRNERDAGVQWREDQRKKLGLAEWEEPRGRCISYGTREYTAQMKFDGRHVCEGIPIDIHHRTLDTPSLCEDHSHQIIQGRWRNSNEPICRPDWGMIIDMGCVVRLGQASGIHRWEARLENVASEDEWMALCQTTPAFIHGRHFSSPAYCQKRYQPYGIAGIWEAEDRACS
ncbi:hypothetical protein WOLCODRAFT_137243 [Wolfiporia cocos MD-104 SS10]|uniref:Uncharacterized protein n=1 Tax=Wolfiporia cocos (strain MD-104) TaxID=742152 RepID=A0A2H3JG68_WOLCO|nr:hypothetical protein WOLCODRAFT_137243 [Wolfiporia cocos MD-104 SS10]